MTYILVYHFLAAHKPLADYKGKVSFREKEKKKKRKKRGLIYNLNNRKIKSGQ